MVDLIIFVYRSRDRDTVASFVIGVKNAFKCCQDIQLLTHIYFSLHLASHHDP